MMKSCGANSLCYYRNVHLQRHLRYFAHNLRLAITMMMMMMMIVRPTWYCSKQLSVWSIGYNSRIFKLFLKIVAQLFIADKLYQAKIHMLYLIKQTENNISKYRQCQDVCKRQARVFTGKVWMYALNSSKLFDRCFSLYWRWKYLAGAPPSLLLESE